MRQLNTDEYPNVYGADIKLPAINSRRVCRKWSGQVCLKWALVAKKFRRY